MQYSQQFVLVKYSSQFPTSSYFTMFLGREPWKKKIHVDQAVLGLGPLSWETVSIYWLNEYSMIFVFSHLVFEKYLVGIPHSNWKSGTVVLCFAFLVFRFVSKLCFLSIFIGMWMVNVNGFYLFALHSQYL